MTKAKKVLAILGLTAVVGAPVAVYAATRGDAKKPATTAKDETIICPLTGEPIRPCCCPLNEKR